MANFKDLKQIERKDFLIGAASYLSDIKCITVNSILQSENGKWYTNPEVEKLAEEMYNMDTFSFDKRYSYPVLAGNLLNRYDIEYSENGVEIQCSDDDKERVKKAMTQLLYPAKEMSSYDNLEKSLKGIIPYKLKD
jgi:hypothetical protein